MSDPDYRAAVTQERDKQVKDIKTRISNMRGGGTRDNFIRATLGQEGWAHDAIETAFLELESD